MGTYTCIYTGNVSHVPFVFGSIGRWMFFAPVRPGHPSAFKPSDPGHPSDSANPNRRTPKSGCIQVFRTQMEIDRLLPDAHQVAVDARRVVRLTYHSSGQLIQARNQPANQPNNPLLTLASYTSIGRGAELAPFASHGTVPGTASPPTRPCQRSRPSTEVRMTEVEPGRRPSALELLMELGEEARGGGGRAEERRGRRSARGENSWDRPDFGGVEVVWLSLCFIYSFICWGKKCAGLEEVLFQNPRPI